MAETILPHALPCALDGFSGIKLLSLDCFDTLLWRDTGAPRDVFASMPGVTVPQRQWAEQRARSAAALRHRRNEVGIDDIYRALLPNADDAARAKAVEAELAAEARLCFAFAPTVALMREAKRRGIGIVIVSDTYLDEAQLRRLIATAAGDDVAALIDRLFCSSVHGRSKGEGLFETVLDELGTAPGEILHIGDNKAADVDGVARFGVHTIHLKQFCETAEQRLRLEAAVGAILHAGAAKTQGTLQPHRAALALGEPQIADPAEALGFSALGPVFHGFQRWLEQEAATLRERHGGAVHWLFLMRDGHLPRLVNEASGGTAGHAVEISRFTSIAASFTDGEAVERYLQNEIGGDLRAVAKQLLLSPAEIAQIFKQLPRIGAPSAFLREVRKPARMRRILKNSSALADRLAEHIRARVAPAPGDTLMLVDLGYNGSVQNEIEPLLRRVFGVQVAGRYLLLREQSLTGFDKSGFIGHDHYDAYTLEALCGNAAVVEQLSTASQGSVVDYRTNGEPVRRGNSIKARQSDIRERIQAGALRFARTAPDATIRTASPETVATWRFGAAAALARLMFLPMGEELAVVAAFEHDVNLGVDDTVALFDPEIARRGLRQRGLFYMKGSERMYLPAELHGEGLSLKLSLLAHRRFGLAFKYGDFVDHSIALPVIIADGNDVSTGSITATPTHDGYFLAPIPVGDCRLTVGVQFGKLYDWVQVDSAVFMPVDRFLSDKQRPGLDERAAEPMLAGMRESAPRLFHCADEFAFMTITPPPRTDDRPMVLALVFRPIAARQPASGADAERAAA